MKKLFAALLLLCVLAAALPLNATADGGDSYIANPDPKDRLHLRESPSTQGRSLGKYYNGAPIQVLEAVNADWLKVTVGNEPGSLTGYVQRKFISDTAVSSAMPHYVSKTDFSAYHGPSSRSKKESFGAGLSISLMGFSDSWQHILVQLPGEGAYSCFLPNAAAAQVLGSGPASPVGRSATVSNPNPRDRLNLREEPSKNAASLGKYYNGVTVMVLGQTADGIWTNVSVESRVGYMLSGYLTFEGLPNNTLYAVPTVTATAAKPVLYEKPSTSNVRSKSLSKGTEMSVYGVLANGKWLHVCVGSTFGYIPTAMTGFQDSAGAQDGGNEKAEAASLAFVSNPDKKDRLHLREKPSLSAKSLGKYYNGAYVSVLEKSSDGQWTKVNAYGRVGYMLSKYLTFEGQRNPTYYGMPSVSATAERPVLYERPSTKNTRTKQLVQGAQLEVLATVDEGKWLHVLIDGITGFIPAGMTDFSEAR